MAVIINSFEIWINPSRNMKIEYEIKDRTETTVDVRFKFTYTKNNSTGYTGYSQYVTPVVDGSTKTRITLKETTPNDWYGDPIEVYSSWYTVNATANETSKSASFTFTSSDPDDANVTKNGTFSFPTIEVSSLNIRVNGTWKKTTPYVRVNGIWKKAVAYLRNNNEWKRGN